ncbi:hypothetical protein T4E_11353 [Trichinella pseudospiralis]|uniref:Uncharacterized protein n=1 Tax=Trichinella pseudospiralis TaxID=6337 RepID=A0A0V0XG48_TRIPS|nr:hypothetical protein T4E_11353 [Trichinella pseudospiralis]
MIPVGQVEAFLSREECCNAWQLYEEGMKSSNQMMTVCYWLRFPERRGLHTLRSCAMGKLQISR